MDLAEVFEAHLESHALKAITLTSADDLIAHGLVGVKHRFWVKWFVEDPDCDEVRTGLVNAGIYVLERHVLNMIFRGLGGVHRKGKSPSATSYGADGYVGFESLLARYRHSPVVNWLRRTSCSGKDAWWKKGTR